MRATQLHDDGHESQHTVTAPGGDPSFVRCECPDGGFQRGTPQPRVGLSGLADRANYVTGTFIALEGAKGVGKTSVCHLLAEQACALNVVVTKEPTERFDL